MRIDLTLDRRDRRPEIVGNGLVHASHGNAGGAAGCDLVAQRTFVRRMVTHQAA